MLRRALIGAALAVLAAASPAAARVAPNASLAGPATVKVGQKATFDATSSTADPAGSIVQYAWDLDGNGSFEEVRTTPKITIVPQTPGQQTLAVRVKDDVGETSVASVRYLVQGAPPVPRLTVPAPVVAGEPVTLDASTSSSPSGTVVAYAWNLDGNGFGADSAEPTTSTTFPAPGTYAVVLRVRDSAEGQATLRRDITVVAPGEDSPAAPGDESPAAAPLGGAAQLGIAPLDTAAQQWLAVGSLTKFAAINGAARRRLGAVRSHGLWVNLLSDRPARFDLRVHVTKAVARRLRLRGAKVIPGYVQVATARHQLGAAGQRPYRLVLPRKVRRALRAPVTLLVRGTATDAAGNRATVSRAFTLRR